jgi:hypothetical protein
MKNSLIKFSILALPLLVLFGCATADIMPHEDGTISAVYKSADKDNAQAVVIRSADKYCEKRHQSAVFINDTKTTYNGTMDEETKSTIRKASRVGMVLGGIGTVPGDTRTAGAVLGTAGTAGTIMTSDKDYETTVKFKCK